MWGVGFKIVKGLEYCGRSTRWQRWGMGFGGKETKKMYSSLKVGLQAMIDQGVVAALATRDANRSTNGEDSHNSGTGVKRTERVARECTYQDFMKCQPLFFKGTEGVSKLTQWFERM
ncbi:hypothetical protein Tco_1512741 [Tanacetum coccineum]